MTITEYRQTPLTVKRNKPVTWYPQPEPGQTAADIRLMCQHARWVKVPDYRRTRSWDEYNGKPPRANPDHTRKTWDGGYIRVRGVDAADVGLRDRFGYWTTLDKTAKTGCQHNHCHAELRNGQWVTDHSDCPETVSYTFVFRCICGTVRSGDGSSILYGHSLSCGCRKAKNRIGHARGCICGPCTLAREVTRQLRERTGHMPGCQCGPCAQLRGLAPLIPVFVALLAELFRSLTGSVRKTSARQSA